MIRMAIALLLVAAALAGPALAGEKTAPKLSQEAKSGARLTQENIVKMKLKTVRTVPQIPQPLAGGPPAPSLPPQN